MRPDYIFNFFVVVEFVFVSARALALKSYSFQNQSLVVVAAAIFYSRQISFRVFDALVIFSVPFEFFVLSRFLHAPPVSRLLLRHNL